MFRRLDGVLPDRSGFDITEFQIDALSVRQQERHQLQRLVSSCADHGKQDGLTLVILLVEVKSS